jgi:hypothetical protein
LISKSISSATLALRLCCHGLDGDIGSAPV